MKTPIADFVKLYAKGDTKRFHMPGHKGNSFLGCESFDITEIKGADALYEASGIIAESEKNAAKLFGSGRTLFSTEGSSQCIRAMLYLITIYDKQKKSGNENKKPLILAARNVHKTFIHAAALLDFDIEWLWPEEKNISICSCVISLSQVEQALKKQGNNVAAVYVTSPDYLGGQCDIQGLAKLCHKYDTILAVDNAHGAYLHFLENSSHPLDCGADICCDSAHKTLPVLTGGAYLHIGKNAPKCFQKQAKYAMGMFGSTSPSYLILSSLDLCNRYLASDYREKLEASIFLVENSCRKMKKNGWHILKSDPLKITVEMPRGLSGQEKAEQMRACGIECEYADPDYIVFMVTPENEKNEFERLIEAMGCNTISYDPKEPLPLMKAEQEMSVREAMLSDFEQIKASDSYGRVCRVPTVSCPPAIPIVAPGEKINKEAVELFSYYGIDVLDVVSL